MKPKSKASSADDLKEARKELQNAQQLYRNGEYRDSLKAAEAIYTKSPSTAVLILLGAIHFQLRNLSESIFYSQQCLRIESNCAEAYCTMGNCLKEMNDLDSAVNFFKKAIRYNPRFADAYNNLGIALFLSLAPQEAIDTFQVATSLEFSHCDALCNIGSVYKVIGKFNDAKEKFLEAIRINPQCAIGWSNLGGIFNDNGDFEQAVTCYHHAIKIMPNGFADAISNSGNALYNLGKESKDESLIHEAAERYRKALELRSDFALCRGCFGLFCLETGLKSNEEANKQLRQAILQDDTNFDAMNNLAASYYTEGRLDDSLKLCLRVLKRKPNHWCAYNNLGNVLKDKVSVSLCHCLSLYLPHAISFQPPSS